jgi:hypothetical protein
MIEKLGNGTKNFAANILLAGFYVRHKPFARCENGNAKTTQDGTEFFSGAIDTTTRLTDAGNRETGLVCCKRNRELLKRSLPLNGHISDPPFLLEKSEKLKLYTRMRSTTGGSPRGLCVADASEEIADGVIYGGHECEE